MSQPLTNITADSLLRGFWYSLKQSGLLLEDAVEAYYRGRLATAVALALVAREELGKSLLLLELRKSGQQLTPREVRDRCNEHQEKQRRGQIVTVLDGRGGGELGRLIGLLQDPEISEDQRLQMLQRLCELSGRIKKRAPGERRKHRERALYVDILDSGD